MATKKKNNNKYWIAFLLLIAIFALAPIAESVGAFSWDRVRYTYSTPTVEIETVDVSDLPAQVPKDIKIQTSTETVYDSDGDVIDMSCDLVELKAYEEADKGFLLNSSNSQTDKIYISKECGDDTEYTLYYKDPDDNKIKYLGEMNTIEGDATLPWDVYKT